MVHGSHQPVSYVYVNHHIIPREWQSKWWPGKEDDIWKSPMLWAPDTIKVCPTGHANVHYHINTIINYLRLLAHTNPSVDVMFSIDKYYKPKANRNEVKVAKQAFINWHKAGGPWDKIIGPSL